MQLRRGTAYNQPAVLAGLAGLKQRQASSSSKRTRARFGTSAALEFKLSVAFLPQPLEAKASHLLARLAGNGGRAGKLLLVTNGFVWCGVVQQGSGMHQNGLARQKPMPPHSGRQATDTFPLYSTAARRQRAPWRQAPKLT